MSKTKEITYGTEEAMREGMAKMHAQGWKAIEVREYNERRFVLPILTWSEKWSIKTFFIVAYEPRLKRLGERF